MCCFTRPVQSVSATNIFARSGAGGRQFIVYGMNYQAKEELAMVLPLSVKPGSGDKAVEFIDLQDYPDFFGDLRRAFPTPRHQASVIAASASELASAPPLPVVRVGQFEASFVPQQKDFARLDERVRLPPGAWARLPQYSAHGFAVFKLKPGAATVHPMAFSFPRARPAELFFPTVHIHDGEVHETARFDHTLYCQRTEGDAFGMLGWRESSGPARRVMKTNKARGLIAGDGHCYQRLLLGQLKNADFILSAGV